MCGTYLCCFDLGLTRLLQIIGYTIDDEPFATYFRLGLTFMDEDRDIIWVIGERPFHAYRISTGRDDPTVVPRPTDFSNMDSIARAESHLNEWKARDEAALQGNVETGGDGSGIARAAREDQNMSDAQMQVSLPPANGSFSKNMANKRQGIDERTNTQSSPKSFGLSLAQMREIWTQFNSSPTMAIHSTMREQAQVTWAKPTAGGQSSSLPKLLAPAPQSTLDTTSHAQAHRKRKVDENDQLDRSSSPKQPRAAQSDSAPINGPRSRTPQQTQGRIVRPPSTSAGQFGRPEKRTHTEYQEDQESMTETASRRRMDWTERKTSSRNSTHQPSVRASELVDPRIGRTAISRDPLTLRSSSGPTFGAPIRYFYPPAPVTAYRELRYESMDRASVASDDMAAAPIAEAAMMTSHQDKRRRASQPEREGLTAESPSSVQQRSPSRQTRMHGRGQSHRHYGQGSNQTQSVPMTTQPRGQRSVGDWMSQQSTNVAGAYSPSLSVHSKLVTFQLLLVPAQERSRSLPIYWTMWNSNRHWPWTSLLATTATGRLGDHLICFPQMSSSMASNRLRLTGACHHHRPAVDHLLSTFSLAA